MKSNPEEDDADAVITQFLEGAPSADTWGSLRKTLEDRLRDLKAQGEVATDIERTKQYEQLKAQISALAQEEAITRFVEDSIRAMISRPGGSLTEEED